MKLRSRAVNLVATLTPAASGAVAAFTLIKPTGSVSKTVITDPQGRATAQFALNRTRDKPGTYKGNVTVTINGQGVSDHTSILVG